MQFLTPLILQKSRVKSRKWNCCYCWDKSFGIWNRKISRLRRRSITLTRHRLGYWRTLECLGGLITPPLLSREPLVVESRARRYSKALDKTLQNQVNKLKIEVTCEVKVRSKVKIRRFDVLGPGDQDYRTWWPKLRQNVVKDMVKAWYEYKWHTKKTSRSRSGHKRSL